MATLYVDRKCTELKLSNDVLICYENDERIGTIPLAPIDRIYLKGDVSVSANLFAKLGEKNIGVVFLSGRKNIPTLFMPQPHNDAERRITQYKMIENNAFCVEFAKNILLFKLVEQKSLIEYLSADQPNDIPEQMHDLILQLQQYQNLASLRGVEGRAAALYFMALSQYLPKELQFSGRNRQPPRDPFNAALSLGYTLLHSEAVSAIYGAGLDPYLGFYHALDYGRESLACDMIEPLRPLLDRWLVECFQQGILKCDDFSTTKEGCLLGKEGRVTFYTEFEKQAEKWRKILTHHCYELVNVLKEYSVRPLPQQRKALFENMFDLYLNATH